MIPLTILMILHDYNTLNIITNNDTIIYAVNVTYNVNNSIIITVIFNNNTSTLTKLHTHYTFKYKIELLIVRIIIILLTINITIFYDKWLIF